MREDVTLTTRKNEGKVQSVRDDKCTERHQPDEDEEDLKRPRERRRKPLCKHVSTELQWRQGNDDCQYDGQDDCHGDC